MSVLAPCRILRLEGAFSVTRCPQSPSGSSQEPLSQMMLYTFSLEILSQRNYVPEPEQPHFNELVVIHPNI